MTGIEITAVIVGVVTGIGGLTLGIVNTWVQFSNNRVKLRIVPMIAYKEEGEDFWTTSSLPFPATMNAIKQKKHRLCAEVTNLGSFSVTIHKFGFGKLKLIKGTIQIPFPKAMKKNIWPLKLESRESDLLMATNVGIDIPIESLDKNCAHVVTECGHVAYGTSHVFDAYVEQLKKESEN